MFLHSVLDILSHYPELQPVGSGTYRRNNDTSSQQKLWQKKQFVHGSSSIAISCIQMSSQLWQCSEWTRNFEKKWPYLFGIVSQSSMKHHDQKHWTTSPGAQKKLHCVERRDPNLLHSKDPTRCTVHIGCKPYIWLALHTMIISWVLNNLLSFPRRSRSVSIPFHVSFPIGVISRSGVMNPCLLRHRAYSSQ